MLINIIMMTCDRQAAVWGAILFSLAGINCPAVIQHWISGAFKENINVRCTLCEKTTGSSRWLLNRVLSTCMSSVGHVLKLGVIYTNKRQRKTELVHFVLKMIFSQVTWRVGLTFWEGQLWLQNHHAWWQILSHFLVGGNEEQSLVQNLTLQKLLCPF